MSLLGFWWCDSVLCALTTHPFRILVSYHGTRPPNASGIVQKTSVCVRTTATRPSKQSRLSSYSSCLLRLGDEVSSANGAAKANRASTPLPAGLMLAAFGWGLLTLAELPLCVEAQVLGPRAACFPGNALCAN